MAKGSGERWLVDNETSRMAVCEKYCFEFVHFTATPEQEVITYDL